MSKFMKKLKEKINQNLILTQDNVNTSWEKIKQNIDNVAKEAMVK